MSWFDQIDLISIQEQITRSVEEASELLNSVNQIEMLNLDDMAQRQEEEEEKQRLIDEMEEQDGDDDEGEEVVYENDPQDRYDDVIIYSTENIEQSDLETGLSHFENSESINIEEFKKEKEIKFSISSTQSKKKQKKKEKKNKKKQKHLDFFGAADLLSTALGEDMENGLINETTNEDNIGGTVWDDDGYLDLWGEGISFAQDESPENPPEDIPDISETIKDDLYNNILASHIRIPQGITTGINLIPQSFNYFDNVDTEIDLAEDPILKQVEENKRNPKQPSPAFQFANFLLGQDNTQNNSVKIPPIPVISKSSNQPQNNFKNIFSNYKTTISNKFTTFLANFETTNKTLKDSYSLIDNNLVSKLKFTFSCIYLIIVLLVYFLLFVFRFLFYTVKLFISCLWLVISSQECTKKLINSYFLQVIQYLL